MSAGASRVECACIELFNALSHCDGPNGVHQKAPLSCFKVIYSVSQTWGVIPLCAPTVCEVELHILGLV